MTFPKFPLLSSDDRDDDIPVDKRQRLSNTSLSDINDRELRNGILDADDVAIILSWSEMPMKNVSHSIHFIYIFRV